MEKVLDRPAHAREALGHGLEALNGRRRRRGAWVTASGKLRGGLWRTGRLNDHGVPAAGGGAAVMGMACVCVGERREGGRGRGGRGSARRARCGAGAVAGRVATQRPGSGPLAIRPSLEATTSLSAGSERGAAILPRELFTRCQGFISYAKGKSLQQCRSATLQSAPHRRCPLRRLPSSDANSGTRRDAALRAYSIRR